MTTHLNHVTIEGRKVWQWSVKQGRRLLASGLCATPADAENDAAVWLSARRTEFITPRNPQSAIRNPQ